MAGLAPDPRIREREEYEEKVRWFNNFLHSDYDKWKKTIADAMANFKLRMPLELQDLEQAEPGLSRKVLDAPIKFIPAWEDALFGFLRDIDEKKARRQAEALRLDIRGAFGRNHVTPRGVTSTTLHKLLCIEGMVIKSAAKQPKILTSMHMRKGVNDGYVEMRQHRDMTSLSNDGTSGAMPKMDLEGHELEMEIGLSVYKDVQKFTVQETPEQTPAGQLPRRCEVVCEGELCELVKPGDRVQVSGVYRPFPQVQNDVTTGVWPSRMIATNITSVKELVQPSFLGDDVKNIRAIAAREDAFQLLSRSFAPSLCGNERVKAGLLLQMIGGTERKLGNGTHIRGDVNVLLVGDPSCGKSQMLRFVMNVAEPAISTTGRGSSGVGLTAAVMREAGSSDFSIEAGAMVLADRGFICIDEFDKMSENDRVAIHEAMEQQSVTITKAGLHTTLNARCSVTAAANPRYGSFSHALTLAENIGLPDSLLSRFDLVFVLRDLTNEELDRKIAGQVLRQAQERSRQDGHGGGDRIHSNVLLRRKEADTSRPQEPAEVFVEAPVALADGDQPKETLTMDFLRKYLRYCKRFTPVVSEEARTVLAEKYAEMRMRFHTGYAAHDDTSTNRKPRLAVTPRTLEGLIRLATAHAKLKLRKDTVLPEDVEQAYRLMLSAREEDDEPKKPAEAAPLEAGDDGNDDQGPSARRNKRKRDEGEGSPGAESTGKKGIPKARVDVLQALVGQHFARAGLGHDQADMAISMGDLHEGVNAGMMEGETLFSDEEFRRGMKALQRRNKIIITEAGEVIAIS
mmetsp:Transcript_26762/g.49158  ORF Transcript_26762/g.49158 Transcript_26762/m.49158 type:complete len:796 (-) Transcript_26762:57-2444(-)